MKVSSHNRQWALIKCTLNTVPSNGQPQSHFHWQHLSIFLAPDQFHLEMEIQSSPLFRVSFEGSRLWKLVQRNQSVGIRFTDMHQAVHKLQAKFHGEQEARQFLLRLQQLIGPQMEQNRRSNQESTQLLQQDFSQSTQQPTGDYSTTAAGLQPHYRRPETGSLASIADVSAKILASTTVPPAASFDFGIQTSNRSVDLSSNRIQPTPPKTQSMASSSSQTSAYKLIEDQNQLAQPPQLSNPTRPVPYTVPDSAFDTDQQRLLWIQRILEDPEFPDYVRQIERLKGDLFLRLCSSFTKSRIMSSSNLQQQQQQPISAAPIPGELGGTVSNDQPTASLKPPTPNQLSAAKTKSKTSLSSALNLNQKQGSKPVLNNSDGMKLQNTGSTKVLADQHELKAIEPIRRIITEDLRWNFGMPKPLTDCCLNSIRKNVTARPFLKRLTDRYRNVVMDGLDLNLPLQFVADNIADNDLAGKKFWKRYCEHYYLPSVCDPRSHDGSWKQTFFELYVQTILETVVPGPQLLMPALIAKLKVAIPFVRRLRLRQLRPESWYGAQSEERVVDINQLPFKSTFTFHLDLLLSPKDTLERLQRKISAKELYEQAAKDGIRKHLDLGECLAPFNKLVELELSYSILEVGMGYRWSLFGMSGKDVAPLRKIIANNPDIELLVLKGNLIHDDLCKPLTEALMLAKSLKKLVLAHNRISDAGISSLADLLLVQKSDDGKASGPLLKYLDLSNNSIGSAGALVIANALSVNSTLEVLKINMNDTIGDEGLARFFKTFTTDNFTLKQLNISGCNAAHETAAALAEAIRHYGTLNARITHEKELIKQGLMLSNAEITVKLDTETVAENEEEQSEDDRKDLKNRRKGKTTIISSKKPTTGKATPAMNRKLSAVPTKEKTKPTPPTTAGTKKTPASGSASGRKTGKSISPSGSSLQLRVQTASSEDSENQDAKQEEQTNNEAVAVPKPLTQKVEPILSNLPFPVGFTHISAQSNLFNDQPNGTLLQDALKQNQFILLCDLRGTNLSDERVRAINFELASRRLIEESTDWNISIEQI